MDTKSGRFWMGLSLCLLLVSCGLAFAVYEFQKLVWARDVTISDLRREVFGKEREFADFRAKIDKEKEEAAAVPPEDPLFEEARSAVGKLLFDPESARFTELRKARVLGVCGYVNSKNRLGGYVGARGFHYMCKGCGIHWEFRDEGTPDSAFELAQQVNDHNMYAINCDPGAELPDLSGEPSNKSKKRR